MIKIQDFICETFGVDANTSATIIITLTVFVTGYVIAGIAKAIAGLIRRRNFRVLFNNMLEEIARTSRIQSSNFEKALPAFKIESNNKLIIEQKCITYLRTVEQLEFSEIYNSLFTGVENLFQFIKIKKFNELMGRIAAISDSEKRYPESLDQFNVKYSEHERLRNQSLEGFRKLADEMIQRTNGTTVDKRMGEYIQQFDQIMVRWQRLENRTNPQIANTELVTKMRKLNGEFPDLNITLLYNNYLIESDHQFCNVKNTMEIYYDVFDSYRKSYQKLATIIEEWLGSSVI